jgi:hypothetical protein
MRQLTTREDDSGSGESAEEGIDFEAVRDLLGFILRAPLRRPILAATALLAVAGLGFLAARTVPQTYSVEMKLHAERNLVLPWLIDKDSVPREADNPTRKAADMILQVDNLNALVTQAKLIDRFYANRAPVLVLKDKLFELFGGPLSDEEKQRNMVGSLQKRLVVSSDDTSVKIVVDWNDPRVAYDLATMVHQNFIKASSDSETKLIEDAIAVLEDHAKSALQEVDSAVAEYRAAQATVAQAAAAQAGPRTETVWVPQATPPSTTQGDKASAAGAAPDAELAAALETKRARIKTLEAERAREVDALKQQMTQDLLTLTPQHPTVMALQQRLDQASKPLPELQMLHAEENSIMSQLVAGGAPAPSAVAASPQAQGPGRLAVVPSPLGAPGFQTTLLEQDRQERDPTLAPARSRLNWAIQKYQENMARIDTARLHLDTVRANFPYRYSIVTPAELPRGPKRPYARIIAVATVPLAFILAFLCAAAADLLSGRVLETWQVRRRLKIVVLGELEVPR